MRKFNLTIRAYEIIKKNFPSQYKQYVFVCAQHFSTRSFLKFKGKYLPQPNFPLNFKNLPVKKCCEHANKYYLKHCEKCMQVLVLIANELVTIYIVTCR